MHTLTNVKSIIPYSIKALEIAGYHEIRVQKFITPYSIIAEERLGAHTLKITDYIYPYGITGSDSRTGGVMTLRYGQFIYLNNSWPNLPGYGPIVPYPSDLYPRSPTLIVGPVYIQPHNIQSVEKASYHRLQSIYPIIPYSVNSEEKNGLHNLTTIIRINQYPILSDEKLGLHELKTISRINPYSIKSLEAIGYHELRRGIRIFPWSILSEEKAQNGALDLSLYKLTGYGSSTEIFLTTDGTNVNYWDTNVYQSAKVIVNSNILSTGYTLYPLEGKVVFDTPIQPTDTVVVNLYKSKTFTLHKLYSQSFIRPYGIRTAERNGRHRLKLPQFPGHIHSWFEKKLTIESELTIIHIPLVGWHEKLQTIEVDIQVLEDINSTLSKVQTIESNLNFRSTS